MKIEIQRMEKSVWDEQGRVDKSFLKGALVSSFSVCRYHPAIRSLTFVVDELKGELVLVEILEARTWSLVGSLSSI